MSADWISARGLVHTYERLPNAGLNDPYFSTDGPDPKPITGIPCLFASRPGRPTDRTIRDARGDIEVFKGPSLLVAIDDPLTSGDRVRNVQDENSILIIGGPIDVLGVEEAGSGVRIATLAGAEAR